MSSLKETSVDSWKRRYESWSRTGWGRDTDTLSHIKWQISCMVVRLGSERQPALVPTLYHTSSPRFHLNYAKTELRVSPTSHLDPLQIANVWLNYFPTLFRIKARTVVGSSGDGRHGTCRLWQTEESTMSIQRRQQPPSWNRDKPDKPHKIGGCLK